MPHFFQITPLQRLRKTQSLPAALQHNRQNTKKWERECKTKQENKQGYAPVSREVQMNSAMLTFKSANFGGLCMIATDKFSTLNADKQL